MYNMSQYAKSIDPNHLVTIGTDYPDGCGLSSSTYQAIFSIPYVDVVSAHDYGVNDISADFNLTSNTLTAISIAQTLNRPLFIGEEGIRVQDVPNLTTRASRFDSLIKETFSYSQDAGLQIFNFGLKAVTSGYDVWPGDPTMTVVKNDAAPLGTAVQNNPNIQTSIQPPTVVITACISLLVAGLLRWRSRIEHLKRNPELSWHDG